MNDSPGLVSVSISQSCVASYLDPRGAPAACRFWRRRLSRCGVRWKCMVTLTVRRDESSEYWFDDVRVGDWIRQVFGDGSGVKWFARLEFQSDGYPHWHVLVDRGVSHRRAELAWGRGFVWVSRRAGGVEPEYAVKYASKQIAGDVPQWALDRVQVRVISSSRGLWAISRVRSAGRGLRAVRWGESVGVRIERVSRTTEVRIGLDWQFRADVESSVVREVIGGFSSMGAWSRSDVCTREGLRWLSGLRAVGAECGASAPHLIS